MKIAATRSARLRRAGVCSAAALALLTATGCSAVSPIATGIPYSPGDGKIIDMNGVGLRNVALVSLGEDEPGRFIGTAVNETDQDQTVEITVGDTTVEVPVEAGRSVSLQEEDLEVETTGGNPGTYTEGTLSFGGASEDIRIPVLGPTQEEYRDLVPGDVDDAEWRDHLYEETHTYGYDDH
ncbi:MAG: hypothetical protein Q4G34_05130 [Micrococcus sp.]|nr:hypothetical protein [Micrococcus sp.]